MCWSLYSPRSERRAYFSSTDLFLNTISAPYELRACLRPADAGCRHRPSWTLLHFYFRYSKAPYLHLYRPGILSATLRPESDTQGVILKYCEVKLENKLLFWSVTFQNLEGHSYFSRRFHWFFTCWAGGGSFETSFLIVIVTFGTIFPHIKLLFSGKLLFLI